MCCCLQHCDGFCTSSEFNHLLLKSHQWVSRCCPSKTSLGCSLSLVEIDYQVHFPLSPAVCVQTNHSILTLLAYSTMLTRPAQRSLQPIYVRGKGAGRLFTWHTVTAIEQSLVRVSSQHPHRYTLDGCPTSRCVEYDAASSNFEIRWQNRLLVSLPASCFPLLPLCCTKRNSS